MSRFAGLPAALKATKATMEAPEDIEETEDDGDGTPPPVKSKRKEPAMADENQSAAVEAAKKEATEAEAKRRSDRLNAIKAHANFAGREAAAFDLAANPEYDALSAEAIGDLLGKMAKNEGVALTEQEQREAAEDGGRKEMKEALEQGKNSKIDAGGGNADGKDKGAESSAIWDRAIARVFPDARK